MVFSKFAFKESGNDERWKKHVPKNLEGTLTDILAKQNKVSN